MGYKLEVKQIIIVVSKIVLFTSDNKQEYHGVESLCFATEK